MLAELSRLTTGADAATEEQPATLSIYTALASHQQGETWELRALLGDLHRWMPIMVDEFKLQISAIALTVERLRCTRYGHFVPGHNGFGLKGEIALNRRYIEPENYWRTLGTLLHELLHAWQQEHGKPGSTNYHNVEFRNKALVCGLVVDRYGHTLYVPESSFFALLKRHGVILPEMPPSATMMRAAGQSKLKKWTCGCTNVRVAIPDFRARCLNCGHEFLPSL